MVACLTRTVGTVCISLIDSEYKTMIRYFVGQTAPSLLARIVKLKSGELPVINPSAVTKLFVPWELCLCGYQSVVDNLGLCAYFVTNSVNSQMLIM